MNAERPYFEAPRTRTQHDSFASGSVLGAMLLAAVAGAFVIAADPGPAAAEISTHYAGIEESQ